MSREKTIEGWIVVDWKEGSHRTRKSKPDSLGTNELLAKLSIDVTVPEVDVPELSLEIDVPEPQVYAATIEALDEEELPDWTDAANEVVEMYAETIQEADGAEFDTQVDRLTTRTLMNVESRPDPANVRDYVAQAMIQLRDGEEDR